ncbi:hypothetical protein BH10ACI3_BH10ACI3_09980 [soil metagenome]
MGVFWYFGFMTQTNGNSKLAGNAGTLMLVVGLLTFFSAVFGFTPRMLLVVGIGLYALSLAAFYIEESGQRREAARN